VVTDISPLQAAASLILVAVVVGLSLWRRLEVEKSVLWATVRATVQLIGVGLLFTVIFESGLADLWAWLWVVLMVVVSAFVVRQRAPELPDLVLIGLAAIALTVATVLAVVFGLGVLDAEPVAIVVIGGITIGNTMPSVVQAADRMVAGLTEQRGQIEAMLSLGFDGPGATRPLANSVISLALVPQIERTKVVGIIALPGAMTGLLLAGVDPIDAVLIQLVVMLLVLGSVAVSVVVVSLAIARKAMTPYLTIADWVPR
jgi:putative ABC transport system permease protein